MTDGAVEGLNQRITPHQDHVVRSAARHARVSGAGSGASAAARTSRARMPPVNGVAWHGLRALACAALWTAFSTTSLVAQDVAIDGPPAPVAPAVVSRDGDGRATIRAV